MPLATGGYLPLRKGIIKMTLMTETLATPSVAKFAAILPSELVQTQCEIDSTHCFGQGVRAPRLTMSFRSSGQVQSLNGCAARRPAAKRASPLVPGDASISGNEAG